MIQHSPRLPDFPSNPKDGQTIIQPLPEGGSVIYSYNQSKNQWVYTTNSKQVEGFVYSDQVLPAADRPENKAAPTVISEDGEFHTQSDLNVWMYDRIKALEEQISAMSAAAAEATPYEQS